ncbi:hypothetical protein SUGI_1047420 [Cryptomeria japonica]|uniref:uncharacterized protein LOC131067528 n=1 Tax=Cryptomeria japonica TaxID=3369 RepID=UPI00241468E5|nr:uncharacterized protein LOC131067528 [Cryptomeria japonica]GLJ49453.1 hypothetical protein SUGI_1047420 [Cryptomeria japonica]
MLEIVEKSGWGWRMQQGSSSRWCSGGPTMRTRKRRRHKMTIAIAIGSNELEYDCYPKRVFLVDVHPLCYVVNQPQPSAFIHWITLLFSSVTINDPIIAVMDGEKGNEYRRRLLPTYKANRKKFMPLTPIGRWKSQSNDANIRLALPYIEAFLRECNVPVIKIGDAEADDVVATLVDQVLQRGLKAVIASPDKDFKQLISKNVQLLMPRPDVKRWSFYTLKHYMAQHECDPSTDLSLRCIIGDENDCIPSLAQVAPAFGRKTAVKLLKKHGSLEKLLNAAAVRTVGRPYAQDALTKHAAFLRRNMQVLSLRRDVRVELENDWCRMRDTSSDVAALSKLERRLSKL